jgi:predicted RNA-binding Zn ribbon-like protein
MVAGETDGARSPGVQPGGRPPAPGDLALVQAFINTHYDLEVEHGAELLATPAGLLRWLAARDLIGPEAARLTPRDLSRAVAVREGLRSLARVNTDGDGGAAAGPPPALATLNEAAAGGAVEVRFAEDGPLFVRSRRGGLNAALGVILAGAARAMLDGTWERLKICPDHNCGWAFYDHSRNRSGRWCSMSVCGGRAKARAHYLRHRHGEG